MTNSSVKKGNKIQRFPLKKEPEVCVGRGILLKSICQQDERSGFEHILHRHEKGANVEISRAIVTAIGPRFRLRNSIVWLGNDEISVDDAALDSALTHVDPNAKAALWANFIRPENRFTSPSKSGTVNSRNSVSNSKRSSGSLNKSKHNKKSVEETNHTVSRLESHSSNSLSAAVPTTPNNNTVSNRKSIAMDKKQLRNVITSLTPQSQIDITFLADKASHSGTWTVLRVKTGRGKGGSKVMDLLNPATKQTLTTGTPESDKILNITVNGQLHGYTQESEIPVSYEKNLTQAALLKESFKRLLPAEGDVEVEIKSTVSDFNGTFTVNKAKTLAGRGGQIVLSLENVDTGAKTELWSYRHSGVITGFTILGDALSAASDSEDAAADDEETTAVIARIRGEQLLSDDDETFAVSEDFDA